MTLAVCSASVPVVAFAARSAAAVAGTLRSKRAQAAKAESQLAPLRAEVTTALARYQDVDAELEIAREEMAAATDDLAVLDTEMTLREEALDERAVAMYKTGGLDMLRALLSVSSLDDLFSRVDLFAYIQQSDADLIAGMEVARQRSATMQREQAQRETQLIALRQEADASKGVVEGALARQTALLRSLGSAIVKLVKQEEEARAIEAARGGIGGEAPPVPFQPNTLISDAAFLDKDSMSAAEIQTFLEAQPGSLKSFSARDHEGSVKTAALMISEAASAWGVNPKVILVTLQKEQSLLAESGPSRRALDWAMGCGKMDSSTLLRYQGFGNQIWGGARALQRNRSFWHGGITLSIDGSAVSPTNAATHSLYRYTPHFPGATSFWGLYWRYFGDPLS